MGYRRIITRVRDEGGNIHGDDAIQVTAVEAGGTSAVTTYLDSAGATTVANPHRAFPGTETQLAADELAADDTVEVLSTIGFTVGDYVTIDGSGGTIRRAIKTILAGPARLQFEKTLGADMDTGATVGGKRDKGLWAAYAVDDRDYETIAENTGNGQILQGPFFPYLSPTSAPTMPNLIPNSDMGRRTKWMTFMPEVFADTSGVTVVTGTAPTAASNLLTAGAASAEQIYREGLSTWRDARFSAQIKLTTDANTANIGVGKVVDADNWIFADLVGGTDDSLEIRKEIASSQSLVASTAYNPTLDNFYWVELEAQGTTYIAKLYSSGASAVAKASATLVATVSGTVADAAVAAGYLGLRATAAITTAAKWGGLSTGDGGVYVEGWGPESWTPTFAGTKGGQAFGFDEAADSGPIEKQWSGVAYIPATSREIYLDHDGPDGGLAASTGYAASFYVKHTGLGGSGVMTRLAIQHKNSAGTTQATTNVDDSAETSWTRKTGAFTSNAGSRRFTARIHVNAGAARTGTSRFLLPQLEQSSVATAWRAAAADEELRLLTKRTELADITTTSTSVVELDPRDLGVNLFLPWDALVEIRAEMMHKGANAGDQSSVSIGVDGSYDRQALQSAPVAAYWMWFTGTHVVRLAAGKHRINVGVATSAGTLTVHSGDARRVPLLFITATKGK